jgi:hypothetical protein
MLQRAMLECRTIANLISHGALVGRKSSRQGKHDSFFDLTSKLNASSTSDCHPSEQKEALKDLMVQQDSEKLETAFSMEIDTEFSDLIKRRIEALRPKLLDLTRNNPLISTKLSPRFSSHVRVIDELPQKLYQSLTEHNTMEFTPLPPMEDTAIPCFRVF